MGSKTRNYAQVQTILFLGFFESADHPG
jgi:hypothetical protein